MSVFNTKTEGATLLIAPEGIVDANNAAAFQDAVNGALPGMSKVIFDFAALEYISSAGLRVLLATQKALGAPGAVHIRNVPSDIMEVLTVTRLAQFMTIE